MNKQLHSLIFLFAELLFLGIAISSCQERFDRQLSNETHDYTLKHLPKRIEAGHTLDSITYQPETRTLHEWHTFSSGLDTPEAREGIRSGAQMLRESVLAHLREDTQWQVCKEEGIQFAYHYRSTAEAKEIMCIVLTNEDYQ